MRAVSRLAPLLSLALLALLAGCIGTRLDAPDTSRETSWFLPPFYWSSVSPDGSSHAWSAALGLIGADVEGARQHARVLPFYWHDEEEPYGGQTLVFPFWYERDTTSDHTRFYSLLYGRNESGGSVTHYVLPPLFYLRSSDEQDVHRSGIVLLYDWRHHGERDDLVLLTALGFATLLKVESGLPADGTNVPALGREASRRIEVGNVLDLISLFGYDDVGDRREWRGLTFFGSEVLSFARSWRDRGDGPFVREWVFPFYMNIADEDGGWMYVGPLWGQIDDVGEQSTTDWWLLGLVARTEAPEGNTWKLAGLPVWGP